MRIAFDGKRNRARIWLTEYDDGDITRWRLLADHEIPGECQFDFDASGRMLGFEIKFASEGLPVDLLADARATRHFRLTRRPSPYFANPPTF